MPYSAKPWTLLLREFEPNLCPSFYRDGHKPSKTFYCFPSPVFHPSVKTKYSTTKCLSFNEKHYSTTVIGHNFEEKTNKLQL